MGALEYIKAALDVAKKAGQVELQSQLMDAREEFNALREENVSLKEQITQLKEELRRAAGAVFFREPWYFTKDDDGKEDGPSCPHCYDTKNLLVRAPKFNSQFGTTYECHACKFERYGEIQRK